MPLVTRRGLLLTGAALAGTALVTAVAGVGYLSTVDVDGLDGFLDGENAVLNAFVVVRADGGVVVNVPRAEMGQGIHTGLAMLVAEEMDLPLDDRVTVVFPTAAHPAYSAWSNVLRVRPEEASGPVAWLGRRVVGELGFIATGASASTMGLWHPMRIAGAAARHMLVEAAAVRLGVPPASLGTADGRVHHDASGRSLAYGELARAAALLPPPEAPVPKPRSAWRLIGRSQPRLDLPAKVRGAPVFGIDVAPPGLLHAAIRHAPVFGAAVARIGDEAAVRALPGVVDVVAVDGRAVAVVAASWWHAERAVRALDVAWTSTEAADVDDAVLRARLAAGLESAEQHVHLDEGDAAAALAAPAARVVEADYAVPFVTHACMEPINATALLHPDGTAEVWASSQTPLALRSGAAQGMGWAGVNPASVVPHVTMNGGGFGRRSDRDVIAEAAFLAARHPGRPVKLIWSREEDVGRGLYRSHAAARLAAALGPDGRPAAYDARVATQAVFDSIAGRNLPVRPGPDGDALAVEGLDKGPYAIPHRRVRSRHVPSHAPIHVWRSNGFSFNTFFSESFVDECALAAGADPLAYRRALLAESPRHRAVLDRAAETADWRRPLPPGRGRGIAIAECYRSVVAQVVEVTALGEREIRVDRVVCALDAGSIVNPDQVVAQMEGGIVFALTTALLSRIRFAGGAVVESNFHDYPMLRLATAPDIEVSLIDSPLPPCGVGEPGVVPTAAALANAVHAATGRRLRSLPLDVALAARAAEA